MTIYMVEHGFARPDWEADWNAWYASNMTVLLGVPGFRTGQRFRRLGSALPRYMAMYTLDSTDVLESQAYKNAGGGGVKSARFRPAYEIWIRNLFEGAESAPNVTPGQYLVLFDAVQPLKELRDRAIVWMNSVGLHRTTPVRGLYVVAESDVDDLDLSQANGMYAPITAQQQQLY